MESPDAWVLCLALGWEEGLGGVLLALSQPQRDFCGWGLGPRGLGTWGGGARGCIGPPPTDHGTGLAWICTLCLSLPGSPSTWVKSCPLWGGEGGAVCQLSPIPIQCIPLLLSPGSGVGGLGLIGATEKQGPGVIPHLEGWCPGGGAGPKAFRGGGSWACFLAVPGAPPLAGTGDPVAWR